MSLEKLIAVSGKGGVYKMIGNRSNGLVLQELDSNKRFFASSRLHQFTPLESISIYTEEHGEDETVSLAQVFINMLEQKETNPPVSPKASGREIRTYFNEILPNHDKGKVMLSDVKKIIKWFKFLSDKGLVSVASLQETVAAAAEEEE